MRQANRHTKTRILGGVLSFARTHGTAAFFLAGSGIDGCFPNMTFVASPPYSLMAPRCYHFRCQTDIQRIVPLSSDSWIKRCKIVEASQNAPSRAVWAARVLYNSCSNDGLPFVPKCASPPNPPVAEGSNLVSDFRCAPCPTVRRCLERPSSDHSRRASRPSQCKPGIPHLCFG